MKKRKGMKKRFAALAMAIILAWTTVDMPIVAAGSQDVSCEHHVEHTAECGYAEGEDGLEVSPCIFECEECADASNDGSDTVSGNEVSEETTECTCGTDDLAFHATNCLAYIAPENPQCTCAEKCTDDTLNVWCDVCGVQGVSVCQGEDTAVIYEEQTTGDFTVTGGTYGQDYTYDSEARLLTIKSSTEITIANTNQNTPTEDRIFVEANVNADIILAGVYIDVSTTEWACAFKIADDSTGNVTITLADGSVNTLKSGRHCAGLQKNGTFISETQGKLTIQGGELGTGVLNATGGGYGAGIGGGEYGSGSNITIKESTVNATAVYYTGVSGAGIGGGWHGSGSNIIIEDSVVNATAKLCGAGIGGGYDGSGCNISIINSTVTATGGDTEPGIGSGYLGDCNDIIIKGGSVKSKDGISGYDNGKVIPTDGMQNNVYLLSIDNPNGEDVYIDNVKYSHKDHNGEKTVYAYLTGTNHTITVGNDVTEYIFLPEAEIFVKTTEIDVNADMDFEITGGTPGTDYLYYENENTLYILTDTTLNIKNKQDVSSTSTVIIAPKNKDANLIFSGVNIDVSTTEWACAFKIPYNSTGDVNITLADGTTNVIKSGRYCAGLQKDGVYADTLGMLNISGNGELIATGGEFGAGIGGGISGSGSNITISGGAVTATGGDEGAGIGGGFDGSGSNITISGGTVTAKGGDSGAGIGGGFAGVGSDITISGGTINAVEGEDANAIGGGDGRSAVTPTDGNGNNVYLFEMNETSGKIITINGVTYPDNHMGESKLYVYLPAAPANEVTINGVTTKYCYDTTNQKWVTAIDIPEEPEETTFTYNGGAKTYVLLENDTYYTITGNVQTNAGNYTVTVSLEDKENTAWSDGTTEDKEYSFVINKADSVLETVPTPKTGLTYKGGGHNLISAGTTTDGEMQYSLDGTNYSSAIPTGTDAKTYTVWYKVDGDENHNDTEPEKVEVTIAPKTVEISSVTAIDRAFDGTNTVEISAVIISGILNTDNVSASATATINSMNAGDYTTVDLSNITLTGSAASNYSIAASAKDVPLTASVNISKADAPTLPSGSKAYVYSIGYEGESVSISGLPTDCGEVEYSLLSVSSDMFENVSVDSRNGKITYDVKELDSYTDDLQGIISVNVMMENYKTAIYMLTITRTEKIPQNISAEDITLTYGDADATISVTGAKTELSYEVVEDSNDNGYVVTVDANGKVSIENAGTAIIKITAEASDTYAESECEIRVTVNKRPVNIKAENYTVKKGDKLPVFEYNVTGLVNDETLPITVSIACTASDTNTVGTYDITVSGVSSEGNYTYIYTNGVLEVLAEDEAPFIMGDDGKMGWDAISDEIADAETGDEVVVDMNGATVVPGDIIEEARDKGIVISFVLDNGLIWTIDGGTVADGDIGDINFGTTIESEDNPLNNIPVDVINNITGEKSTIEVNLAYSGEFGFTAVLTTNLSSDNSGYYANLFYYNPTNKELEYVCADVIADDGTAELTFTHASDYLIVIDDEDLGVVKDDDDATTEDSTDATTEDSTDATTEEPADATTSTETTTTTENVTTTETITDKNTDDSAKTGDNTPLAAVMVMMMISVMGLIFGNKKKRNA